jgi:hypothetical protein
MVISSAALYGAEINIPNAHNLSNLCLIGLRRQTVEHVFGTLKAWVGSTPLLTRTLEKVRTEISLAVLAYNMKRVIRLLGVGPLLQAIRA